MQTTDSTYVQVIRNSLVWNSLSYKTHESPPPPFFLYFGAEHAAYKLSLNSLIDTVFQSENKNYDQLSVLGGLQLNLFKSTRIFADARIIVGGGIKMVIGSLIPVGINLLEQRQETWAHLISN